MRNLCCDGTMSFEKLIEDYTIINNMFREVELDGEELPLNEVILELEQNMNPDLTDIDWSMFDYVYVNIMFEIRTDTDDPYDINNNYAAVFVGTAGQTLAHALDFVDNNRNGGKQVMEQIFSSSFLQSLTGKNNGGSLQYYSLTPEDDPMGTCRMLITLFKKTIKAADLFTLENYTVDINSSINFSYKLTPSVPNWSGYGIINVLYSINGIQYTTIMQKSNKDFKSGAMFYPPVVDINGTEITRVFITYLHYGNQEMPQGVTINVIGNDGTGDGKAYINGLTFVVSSYV
ncbi:MAG: hypothetical protein LBJ88_05640 [Campylobacteraceae bacterium]|jgi:hypothetical protein|nr:hypothetical protein [Campylobacteraceae bacterium]